ncbi:hypothetical protein ABPG72_017693, partial [Tetrahymena utriculariae]
KRRKPLQKIMFDGLRQAIKHQQALLIMFDGLWQAIKHQKALKRRKPLQKPCLMALSKPSNMPTGWDQYDPKPHLPLKQQERRKPLSKKKNINKQSRGRNLYLKIKNNNKGAILAWATKTAAYRSEIRRELITSCEFLFSPHIVWLHATFFSENLL